VSSRALLINKVPSITSSRSIPPQVRLERTSRVDIPTSTSHSPDNNHDEASRENHGVGETPKSEVVVTEAPHLCHDPYRDKPINQRCTYQRESPKHIDSRKDPRLIYITSSYRARKPELFYSIDRVDVDPPDGKAAGVAMPARATEL
jgi:hypothetical protein